MAVGSAKSVPNGQDTFGGHFYGAADYSGPASYATGGDTIDPHIFGFPNTILTLTGSVDQTDTYRAEGRPLYNGTTAWKLVWFVIATGLEVGAAVNLSGVTVRLGAIGY
jgi:hypothetical protein